MVVYAVLHPGPHVVSHSNLVAMSVGQPQEAVTATKAKQVAVVQTVFGTGSHGGPLVWVMVAQVSRGKVVFPRTLVASARRAVTGKSEEYCIWWILGISPTA
jgi:hypothetical protein